MTTTQGTLTSAQSKKATGIIYARVSADTSKTGRSVKQQVDECTTRATELGITIREVVEDNSIGASRYSAAKTRPGFEHLKAVLRQGDTLFVWESSRIARKLSDHLLIRNLCEDKGIRLSAGERVYDFSKTSDREMAGHEAVTSEAEASRTRDRVLRAVRARAAAGRPHSALGFGWTRSFDPETGSATWYIDANAEHVRDAVERILSGATLYSIVRDWNSRGILTTAGNPWQPRTLKQLLVRPSYAGLRVLRGQVVGQGDWPAIISEDQHTRIVAVLRDPRRSQKHGSDPVHLLTGIAECSVCGEYVRYQRHSSKQDQYRCPLGHVGRSAAAVDEYVLRRIFRLIEKWQIDTFLTSDLEDENTDDTTTSSVHLQQARELRQRLDSAVDQFSSGALSAASLARIESTLLPQIENAERLAHTSRVHPLLAQMIAQSPQQVWESFDIEKQRALVRTVVRVVIYPTMRGQRVFDESSVVVTWR